MYRARNMKNNEDLELRLGRSPKGLNPRGNTFPMGYPELINIEDDDDYEDDHNDDEVQVFSHRPAEGIRFFARFSSWTPVISDEDLELRLGPREYVKSERRYYRRGRVCYPLMSINVTDRSGCRSEEPLSLFCNKKQLGQASSSQLGMGMNQLKLRCNICMDTMKEETSTVCGHVFCKPCITNAIKIQNKCPTCREKLTQSSIHRIYLPGTT